MVTSGMDGRNQLGKNVYVSRMFVDINGVDFSYVHQANNHRKAESVFGSINVWCVNILTDGQILFHDATRSTSQKGFHLQWERRCLGWPFFFFHVQAGIMRPVFSGGKRGRAQDTIALEDLRGIDTKQTRWFPWEPEEGYISAQSCTPTSAGSPGRTNRDVSVPPGSRWRPSSMLLNIRGGCWNGNTCSHLFF